MLAETDSVSHSQYRICFLLRRKLLRHYSGCSCNTHHFYFSFLAPSRSHEAYSTIRRLADLPNPLACAAASKRLYSASVSRRLTCLFLILFSFIIIPSFPVSFSFLTNQFYFLCLIERRKPAFQQHRISSRQNSEIQDYISRANGCGYSREGFPRPCRLRSNNP